MQYWTWWDDINESGFNVPEKRCDQCRHYHMIDSGYGWCQRYPPKRVLIKLMPLRHDMMYPSVPWCLPACGEFRQRPRKEE